MTLHQRLRPTQSTCLRFLLGALCLPLISACKEPVMSVSQQQSVRPARIFEITAQDTLLKHSYIGRIEAVQTIDVSFEVSGPLDILPVREGQNIPAGTLLAALDPTDYELARREAEGQLSLAQQDLERKRKLLTRNGISESAVDDAQALTNLRQVRLEQAIEDLNDARIYAPFDAYVARRFTDSKVNVTDGQPILRLLDLSELLIVTNVPEGLLATATPERVESLRARFSFLPQQSFELTYRENRGEANAVAQTYEITFAMPPPTGINLLPGMTARVDIALRPIDQGPPAIHIPTSALVAQAKRKEGFFVWRYDPDTQVVSKVPIKVGQLNAQGVHVLSGLSDGDLIVTSGAAQLQQGMSVRRLADTSPAM